MAKRLSDARPVSAEVPPSAKRALLHGDPVPGNILVTPDGLRLIDWQCPAVGDPVEDLALFLSPAMQLIYRGAPLTRAEGDAFTAAYADPQVQDRLNAMQPWHHWAMAAYCAWKAARGAQRYAQAMELELAALEQNL
jgi:aminoglycoside phosphotransferase (APT) family kinase protein